MEEKSEEAEEKFKIKPLKPILWIDWIILLIVTVAITISLYDLSHLNKIENNCINKCNEHWLNEFRISCQNDMYKENIERFNYSIIQISNEKGYQ